MNPQNTYQDARERGLSIEDATTATREQMRSAGQGVTGIRSIARKAELLHILRQRNAAIHAAHAAALTAIEALRDEAQAAYANIADEYEFANEMPQGSLSGISRPLPDEATRAIQAAKNERETFQAHVDTAITRFAQSQRLPVEI